MNPEQKHKKAGWFLAGALTGAGAAALVFLLACGKVLFGDGLLSTKTAQKLSSLQQLIDEHYYQADQVTDDQLREGVYKGLLEALDDPYSVYYTQEEVKKLDETISGTYDGIGAYVSMDTDMGCPRIAGIIAGSPAEKAGLMEGDLLWEADGESLKGLDLDVAVSSIKGEKGTPVELTVIRDGEKLTVTVTRDEVQSETVQGEMLEDGIGYLQIAEFDEVTPDQFTRALESLQKEDMKGLILDLRGNPGGTVTAVTSIAQYLVPEGLIFYMEYPDGSRKEYKADGTKYTGLPVAVLVNENSASASEILSSAIQDSGTGTVIGTKTYGKGVVQTAYALQDGTEVKLTIAEYFTRNGSKVNKTGVTPDREVALDTEKYRKDGTDSQLEAAVETIKKEIK